MGTACLTATCCCLSSSSEPRKAAYQYLPFLDGMRALAILWVMGFHTRGPIAGFLAQNGGWSGVDIFFVISGFLITGILLREQNKTGSISLKNFYIRRMLRLLPVYYLLLSVILIFNPTQCKDIVAAVAIAFVYMSNFDLALGWGHIIGSGLEVTWSLAVEEQFYSVWPSVIKFCRKHLWHAAAGLIVLCEVWKAYLILHQANCVRMTGGFDTRIDMLMFGVLAALAINDEPTKQRLTKLLSKSWLAPVLLLTIFFYVHGIGHPSTLATIPERLICWDARVPALSILTALLILALVIKPKSIAGKFLSHPVMTYLGRISYSLYLWHSISFFIVNKWLAPFTNWYGELAGYGMAIAIASGSYHLVESPFLRLKERFTESRSAVLPGTSAPVI
jgi:peptidoglycan/LPS O-acetylase OafA/YrhL